MTRVLVLETSYLCELYQVPGFSDEGFGGQLRKRFAREAEADSRFFLPIGCLYELCDHVADVGDGSVRHRLAGRIAEDVERSVNEAVPWTLQPSRGVMEAADFVRAFASDPGRLAMGLTKSDIIEVASRLKRKYGDSTGYRVHIWTRNRSLKAHEPGREPDPLL